MAQWMNLLWKSISVIPKTVPSLSESGPIHQVLQQAGQQAGQQANVFHCQRFLHCTILSITDNQQGLVLITEKAINDNETQNLQQYM